MAIVMCRLMFQDLSDPNFIAFYELIMYDGINYFKVTINQNSIEMFQPELPFFPVGSRENYHSGPCLT